MNLQSLWDHLEFQVGLSYHPWVVLHLYRPKQNPEGWVNQDWTYPSWVSNKNLHLLPTFPNTCKRNFDNNKLLRIYSDPSGKLNFAGKAIIHADGVNFSNGNSFAIKMDDLILQEELGKGQYGTVQKVKHRVTNVTMAMKVIHDCFNQEKRSFFFKGNSIRIRWNKITSNINGVRYLA